MLDFPSQGDPQARFGPETAAAIRDQLRALEVTLQSQKVVSTDFVDQDVIGVEQGDPIAARFRDAHVARAAYAAVVLAKVANPWVLTPDQRLRAVV